MKQFIGILIVVLLFFLIFKRLKEGFTASDNKLIAIIPVRDREMQLNDYLNHMIPIFKDQNIDYKIYIVEQSERNFLKSISHLFCVIKNLYFILEPILILSH